MVPFACEIFPKSSAAPAELKRLGKALVIAVAHADLGYCHLDLQALRDLLSGDMPGPRRPLPEEVLAGLGSVERHRVDLLVGRGSSRPSVYINEWGGGRPEGRRRTAAAVAFRSG